VSKSDNFQSCRHCGDRIELGRTKFCEGDECRFKYRKANQGLSEVRHAILKKAMGIEKVPFDDPLYKPSVYFDLIKNGSALCTYCDGPMAPTGHGLDRKDSAVGHQFSNVVVACSTCNFLRSPHGRYNGGKDLFTHAEVVEFLRPGLIALREAREMAAPKRKQ
jgi:hypothetical protein